MHITKVQMIQLRSHYENGKTVEEISTMTGISIERVAGLVGADGHEELEPLDGVESTEESEPEASDEDWEG